MCQHKSDRIHGNLNRMEGDLFVQSATEAHYEWLEQGREAPLSLVKTLALDVFSLLDLQNNPSLLLDSLHKYGIVLVFEHGVGDFFEQSRQFFALSTSAKMELAKPPIQPSKELVYTPVSSNSSSVPPPMKNASFFAPPPRPVIYSKAAVGFVPTHFERLNPFSRPDVKECFDFVCDVHGKGSHLGKSPFPKIKNFEKDATRYFNENLTLARTMLDLIVTASKLPKDVMNQHFEKPLAIQRLLSYPPQNSDTPNELGAGSIVGFVCSFVTSEKTFKRRSRRLWCDFFDSAKFRWTGGIC